MRKWKKQNCVHLKKGEEQHYGSLEDSAAEEAKQSCVILCHCV